MKKTVQFNSLFKKILLWYGIALLVFSIITGVLFGMSYARYSYDTYLTDMAKSIAKSINDHVENTGYPLGCKDPSEVKAYTNLISSASNLPEITVWLINKDKELMSLNHQSGKLEFDHLPTRYNKMMDYMFEGNNVHNDTYRKIWNKNMFGVGTPIMDSGGFVSGVVLVQTSYLMVGKALSTALLNLLFSLLAAAAVTLVIALFMSKIFTDPLQKIRTTALQLKEGNYQVHTDVHQPDELGQLAGVIDDLALRLEKAEEEQKGLEKMRQDFISGISHELRTPVTVMRASLEALCDGYVTEPEKVNQYHHTMLQDSIQLQRLVNDLLDLSRLQAVEFQMEKSVCSPCEILIDAVASATPLAEKNGISLEFNKLCEKCCQCKIWADYGRLRQLFSILIDNAIKYSETGGKITVTIDSGVVCTIKDEGCGIESNELPHIFERFYRGQSGYGNKKDGSGLGLAIATQIADHHGIEMSVESTTGAGSEFTLRLPEFDNTI